MKNNVFCGVFRQQIKDQTSCSLWRFKIDNRTFKP